MKKRLFYSGFSLVMLVVLVMALAACTSAPSPTTTSTPSSTTTTTTTTTSTTGPASSITVTSPGNGGSIFAIGGVTVNVTVANFNLVDKLGQANVAGEGHIHYFMDVTPPTTPNQPAVTAAGTYAATTATSYTWKNVGGGAHTFSVELVNNNHTPLVPPVVATVLITVIPEIGLPQAVILQPRDGAIVPAGDVTVSVQVSNFNLVDKLGQANASHEGHIHYFLDVTPPTTQGQPAIPPSGSVWAATANATYTFKNVAPGSHTISIELVNNDHTPLDPAVVTSVTIKVQGPITTSTSTTTITTSPTTTNSPPPSTTTTSGNAVTIDLVAKNIAFDLSTITVPAGAQVTVNFDNQDSGIPHNFAVYTDSSASTPIFVGQIITGPKTATYTFTAPATPGSYFFRCDVHPTIMTGTFIVQ
jgi:plastocyanin